MSNPLYDNSVTTRPAMLWGPVLLLGLGVGEMVGEILKHKAVTSLVVVEFDADVIQAFADAHGDSPVDRRLLMIEGDAVKYHARHHERFTFICQDLWSDELGQEHWIKLPKGVQLWELK